MQQVAPMRKRRRRAEGKNGVLRAMARHAGYGIAQEVELDDDAANWDALLAGLAQFEANLEQQKGQLAVQVAGNVARFRARVHTLAAKWAEIKPSGVKSCLQCAWFALVMVSLSRSILQDHTNKCCKADLLMKALLRTKQTCRADCVRVHRRR
jgi:hypothetical protein